MCIQKIKLSIFITLVGVMFFSSCRKDEDPIIDVKSFSLNQSDILLGIDEIQAIIAAVSPENSTQGLSWTSSDESIAKIQYNESGRVAGVKGIALGKIVLTAKSADGKVVKTINVQVLIKIQSIALEEEPIDSDTQTRYKVIFTPENATIQDVVWESDNPGVISVSDGVVTAVSAGSAVITAKTVEGDKTASVSLVASGDPAVLGLLYCSASGTGSYNPDVVTTSGGGTNLNHNDGQPSGNYNYYEDEILTVAPDVSFDISVKQSNNWSMTIVWVDWNGDKDFTDSGEQVQVFGNPNQLNDGPFSATISVPSDATPNQVRMRVLTGDAWTTDPSTEPCGEIANSTIKDFTVNIVGVLYCPASGTGAYNADTVVTTGASGNINYSGGQPSGNYEFYTGETLEVAAGNSFNLSVTQSNNWSMTVVWVDWNADGDFGDADEQVQVFGIANQLNEGPFSAQIDVPATATQGKVRMRVLTGDAWTTNLAAEPCGEIANSTIKDFNIEIL